MNRTINNTWLIALFIAAFTLFGCDSNKVFEEYIDVENGVWKKENVAKFSVEISDTNNLHNLYLNIRNKGTYPFSNLYLFVTIQAPDGSSNTDTVNCELADKRGKWLGKGVGDLWDVKVPYIGGFKFTQEGKYQVFMEQAMRAEDGLDGISDVGLRIERKEN